MRIYGLQKMTLLDFPGRVACTVFLSGCDFRCPFCHNFDLALGRSAEYMEEEDFFGFLEKRKGLLDGVAITGGEPCLYRELPDFMRKIKEKGFSVKLDTNGYHPELLEEILNEGLADYIAMDIKNSEKKYPMTCGVEKIDMEKIKKSIDLIMKSGADYEFRTTAVKELHDTDDFLDIGKMIQGAKRYFIQAFVKRDSVPDESLSEPSKDKLEEFLDTVREFVPSSYIRGVD